MNANLEAPAMLARDNPYRADERMWRIVLVEDNLRTEYVSADWHCDAKEFAQDQWPDAFVRDIVLVDDEERAQFEFDLLHEQGRLILANSLGAEEPAPSESQTLTKVTAVVMGLALFAGVLYRCSEGFVA